MTAGQARAAGSSLQDALASATQLDEATARLEGFLVIRANGVPANAGLAFAGRSRKRVIAPTPSALLPPVPPTRLHDAFARDASPELLPGVACCGIAPGGRRR